MKIRGLKSCPFCGTKRPRVTNDALYYTWFVMCRNCFARGPIKATENKAALAWHGRFKKKARKKCTK